MKNTFTPMPPRKPAEKRKYPIYSFEKACELIEERCGDVQISECHGNGTNKVIILPEASQELKTMVSYGRRSPMNIKEQKFTGYGHLLRDENGNMLIIVKHFIEIMTMNRNSVGASNLGPNGENNPGLDFLEYHREEFLKYEAKFNTDAYGNEIDPFMKFCGGSEFVLEGHTHPDLGCFFSQPDRVSGSGRAATTPICIFVCDPIRKDMLGSIGSSFADAEVVLYEHCTNSKSNKDSVQTLSSPEEIVRLSSHYLRMPGYSGNIKMRRCFRKSTKLKIKLIIPAEKSSK